MIDSGAERSILPQSLVPQSIIFPDNTKLVNVSGNPIHTYGHCLASIGVKALRREFKVQFILTDTKPILGADFLTQYGLHLDMRNKRLIDPLTNISSGLTKANGTDDGVKVSEVEQTDDFLVSEFPDLLKAPDYSSLPYNSENIHHIITSGPPVFSKPRPLPPDKYQIAKTEFDHLLSLGIVRPSSSPWASPLHMVKKSDGSWRPCGDYRRLNAVTVPDRYAIPNIETIHHKLSNSTIYSRLDLVKAYHFVPVNKEDVSKTAICTPFGTFEYVRMPFGLRNAANTFQRFIDDTVRGLPFVVTYIDDLLIYSETVDQHKDHLRQVLRQLQKAGLCLNKQKTSLFQSSINFLGFQFSKNGIKPLPDKVQALVDLSPPNDSKCLQRYLGMFGFYQRCIPKYSKIAYDLRHLLRKGNFEWTPEHQSAFDKLKTTLKDAVELSYALSCPPILSAVLLRPIVDYSLV